MYLVSGFDDHVIAPDEIGLNSHESGQYSLVTSPIHHAITGQLVANPKRSTQWVRRGNVDGMLVNGGQVQHGKLLGVAGERAGQRLCRKARIRPLAMSDGVVVPVKSGNADGGKDPWSWNSVLQSASNEVIDNESVNTTKS